MSYSGLKRKCYDLSQTKNFKRFRRTSTCNILNLSDCTLMHILKYMDATDLFQLWKTCSRFRRLVLDESLWTSIEARMKPINKEKSDFCWQNVSEKTRKILTAGTRRSGVAIPVDKLIANPCLKNLTVLALENQCVKYCRLINFPDTLVELSFKNSYICDHNEFFRFGHSSMKNLKTLILDHCKWLTGTCFLSICKFPELEILSLYMCTKLGEDDMTTFSLAGYGGFFKIKVLDLRFTDVGDTVIRTCYKKPMLQVMYLQSYANTYTKEYEMRLNEIENGKKMRDYAYEKDDRRAFLRESLKSKFNCSTVKKEEFDRPDDQSLKVLHNLQPATVKKPKPKSFLYKYPYEKCTCEDSRQNTPIYGCLIDIDEIERSEDYNDREVLYQIMPEACWDTGDDFDSCSLPEWSTVLATPENCEQKWIFVREPRNDYEIEFFENTDKNFRSHLALKYFERTLSNKKAAGCYHDSHVVVFSEQGAFFPMRGGNFIEYKSNSSMTRDHDMVILAMKISEYLEEAKTTKCFEIAVHAIITSIIENVTKITNLAQYLLDSNFTNTICRIVRSLCNVVSQRFIYVLNYHLHCITHLIDVLKRTPDERIVNQKMLVTFFENLLVSERASSFDDIQENDFDNEQTTSGTANKMGPISQPLFESESMFAEGTSSLRNVTLYRVEHEMVHNVQNLAECEHKGSLTTDFKELSLRGYKKVTDTAFEYLGNLGLELLDVTGTSVTLAGLRTFHMTNPNCRIIHKYACRCRPNMHF